MSVCFENSTTALIQPVVSSLSTNAEVIVPTCTTQTPVNPISLHVDSPSTSEIKPTEPYLSNKSIAKLLVTNQHGSATAKPVFQKVVNVNSPLITVLNSTGPLTVVKSLCVTSVVSSAPHYTLVNSTAPLNVSNTAGKPPTITVLNCGSLTSPVTVVKTITTQQAIEKSHSDVPPVATNNGQTSPALIENRGHNVYVKSTCPDSTIPDNVPQSHKLLTATNFSTNNVLTNIATTGNKANGQRNKLKILSNVQIASPSQQNVILNKTPSLPQPRYNVTARQKLIGVNNTSAKYLKSPNNVLKPAVNSTIKSPQDKPGKLLHPPVQKGPIKSLPPNNIIQKPQQGIKTLSPQHKNVPGQVQRTGSGLRTIPPQRPQKMPTKPNYIGKHAVQAQKVKHQTHGKLKSNVRPSPPSNMYGNYHMPPIHTEKQLTFNQALTAQIIETLSSSSGAPPVANRYEISPARYDSAFNCPDKQVLEPPAIIEEKAKSGLDLIYQIVLLDHNYNATLPSESPPRPPPPINTQAQVNGVPPTNVYNTLAQNKRRILPPANSLLTPTTNVSLSSSNSASSLISHINRSNNNNDDAASDISDGSDRKHDTEGEETDTAPEAEDVKNDDHYGDYVTRCICRFVHDDGYMVECDKCKVWQHVQCVVKNRQIPDEYLCEICDPTKPVDRQKARLIQEQWIRERQLIEPKIRKEAKLKETIRLKEHSDSDSSDGERMVCNNNIVAKNRTVSAGRRKSDAAAKVPKKDGKETVQRRQKRKEKKIVKRKSKLQTKNQQSHSDDENQDTWSAHLPQLRQWIEKYEEAVTNHYSPELRARISSIRVNGVTAVDSTIPYDETVCKCRIHTQPLTEIKYLVSTVQLEPNTSVIELRGKYMLSTQHRNAGGSLTTRQHTQRPGPFLFFYRLHKDNTEVCVDTRTYGNSARFIRRSCKPNAELRHCIEKGVLHLYIVTIAPVEKNCELTIKHESHDLAAIGTTQIACACGRPDECTVNKTTIKKNGEAEVTRKRRGRRTISASILSPDLKSPIKEKPPTTTGEPVAIPLPPPPTPVPTPVVKAEIIEDVKEEKIEIIEPIEVKVEEKEEEQQIEAPHPEEKPLEEKISIDDKADVKIKPEAQEEQQPQIKEEEKKQRSPSPQPPPLPPPPPVKVEVKKEKEKPHKEDKIKSPPPTPISTRRSSHHKSDKEDNIKESETKEPPTKSKKLSREERKLEAILRAIEQMEKADQKKQEHQAKQAHRRESEPGPGKEEEKPEGKIKRRRRRGRARTTSTSAQTRRSRLNSTDSYMTSGDENLLSPNDAMPPVRPTKEDGDNKAAGLLLALSNGDSENNKDIKKSPARDHDSSSNSAHSSPDTPQLSSACLLVQAAVEPLESGFKFPKTKKGLMNEWLNKTPDPVQSATATSPVAFIPHLGQQIDELGTPSKNLSALAQAASFCETSSQQRGGNAKKRWLRQAISEDHTSDALGSGRPDSPTMSEAVAPPKKRKLPRESLSNDNSPPTTPTGTGPAKVSAPQNHEYDTNENVKSIDTPRSSQEGSVEIVYNSGTEGDSPSHTMESDAELKERAAKMKQEFGKTVTLTPNEAPVVPNNFSGILMDPRLTGGNSIFSNSEHLVGTVEKTLSILGFESPKPQVSAPVKRKVKLSITEYLQRKKLNPDKSDDQDVKNDSQSNEDNNSSESFKNEAIPKARSRSSSSSSSLSSSDELLTPDVLKKAPVFNCEPTELERQREISSLRLKKAFGFNIDDESRKPSDMNSILKCDMDSKIKPTTLFSCIDDLSMSPTLRVSVETSERTTYTPPANPRIPSPVSELCLEKMEEVDVEEIENKDNNEVSKEDKLKENSDEGETVTTMDVDLSEETEDEAGKENVEDVSMKSEEEEKKESDTNMFYTPDDDEDRGTTVFEESESVNYVPPFNNPVYPSSNFASFTSTIDDDSRYQSRNPSPPPDIEANSSFDAS